MEGRDKEEVPGPGGKAVSLRRSARVASNQSAASSGGSKAFSRERAVSMMKVLAKDGKVYRFGRDLYGDENPLGISLQGLEYDEDRGLVSLVD